LRQLDHPEIHSAFSALDKLDCDHRWAMSLHDKVERLGAQNLSIGKLSDDEIAEFRISVASSCRNVQGAHPCRGASLVRHGEDGYWDRNGRPQASEASNRAVLNVTVRTWTRLCHHVT